MNTHQDPYLFDDEAENQRLRKQPYNRNLSHREGRNTGQTHQNRWDESNYFHTGPSERGSSQYEKQQHPRQPQQNVHRHYANRPDSTYRHPESKINFGDRSSAHQQTSYDRYKPYYTDESHFRHAPSDRDLYKADDYRYRSGHYNWNAVPVHPHGTDDYDADDMDRDRRYAEGHRMYYAEDDRDRDRNEGFLSWMTHGIRDAWNTVVHRGHEDDYDDRNEPQRYRSEGSGDRFRRGYESGPRWADEHRTHHEYRHHPGQSAQNRWPEDPNRNRRGQEHGYNPDPNNDW